MGVDSIDAQFEALREMKTITQKLPNQRSYIYIYQVLDRAKNRILIFVC